jgi:hypothetical protein
MNSLVIVIFLLTIIILFFINLKINTTIQKINQTNTNNTLLKNSEPLIINKPNLETKNDESQISTSTQIPTSTVIVKPVYTQRYNSFYNPSYNRLYNRLYYPSYNRLYNPFLYNHNSFYDSRFNNVDGGYHRSANRQYRHNRRHDRREKRRERRRRRRERNRNDSTDIGNH